MNSKLLICLAILAFALPAVAQQKAKQPIFSLDFDDGYQSAFEHALPILNAAHMKSTWFIITNRLGKPEYVTRDEVVTLFKDGEEIGSHTVSHPNLADLSVEAQTAEIKDSRDYLYGLIGYNPVSFAYPYGSRNDATFSLLQRAGYTNARTIDWGMNVPGFTAPYELESYCWDNTTTWPDIKQRIDRALSDKVWMILVFHRFNEKGNPISVDADLLQQTVDYLAKLHATVVTQQEGWTMLQNEVK